MIYKIVAISLIASAGWGAEEFTALTGAAEAGKEVIQSSLKSWLWVAAFIPFGFGWFLFSKTKDYMERQEESGQYQPKAAKYASLVGSFVAGVLIIYLVYGVLGATFFNASFADMWKALVTDFFETLI